MARSEHEDSYDAYMQGESEELRGAILNDPLRVIDPAEPILCGEQMTVREAIELIKKDAEHQGAVLIVDKDGKLLGIFSERDIMVRVVGRDLDVKTTTLGDVMTRDPLALGADDKIAKALHLMATRGFRNIPIVNKATKKPIGIVFTRHFIKYLVSLFPEQTLNLAADMRNPELVDGG